jgi:hypothetical protein
VPSFGLPIVTIEAWLVVESHPVHLLAGDSSIGKAPACGVCREIGVVFISGKALLLRGRNYNAVLHERSRAVMIVGRDSQNDHFRPSQKIA